MNEEKTKAIELFTELAKHNRYFEGLLDATLEFLEGEGKGLVSTLERFKSKIESVETLYRDDKKEGQVMYDYLRDRKPYFEELQDGIEVQPLITDGKLLVPYCGDRKIKPVSIEKLQAVLDLEENVSEKMNGVVLSFAEISCNLMNNPDIDMDTMQGCFPESKTMYLLSLIADAFKE